MSIEGSFLSFEISIAVSAITFFSFACYAPPTFFYCIPYDPAPFFPPPLSVDDDYDVFVN